MNGFCENCGSSITTKVSFCKSCGTPVREISGNTREDASKGSAFNGPYHQDQQMYNRGRQIHCDKTNRLKPMIIGGISLLVLCIAMFIFIPHLTGILNKQNRINAQGAEGQFYAGRAISIKGEGFGDYSNLSSNITIAGMDAPIITWEDTGITVIVPKGVKKGTREIIISNEPYYDEKTMKMEFGEHTKTQVAKEVLSPLQNHVIEGENFTLLVPAGSVSQEEEILIYRYESPSADDSLYYTVVEEYEVTGPEGGHIFFENPVFFGMKVADEEEALQSSVQIFDEYMGEWVSAETMYNKEDGMLYLKTTHFSGFRRFVSEMVKGTQRVAQQAVDKAVDTAGKISDAVTEAKDFVAGVAEEAWFLAKDQTTKFVGVPDSSERFIVFYRATDAKEDPTIPEKARQMASAFSSAYTKYMDLFGEDNLPPTRKGVLVPCSANDPEVVFTKRGQSYKTEYVSDPIYVYIDPRYNKSGAKYSVVTKNITMPSEYPHGDLASTCAHELFHAVQYQQLGLKQIYMANGFKNMDGTLTGGDANAHRFFSNNKWFLEATAEYAALFIGTDVGVGAPMHKGISASLPYYAFNSYHEYGVSSFLDYIVTSRQTDQSKRAEEFKDLWDSVSQNYSLTVDINTSLEQYTQIKLGESPQTLYEEFWRETFTCLKMPDPSFLSGGVRDFVNMAREGGKSSGMMNIKKNGVGVFRYLISENSISKDDTALTRSFWLEASPSALVGDVYVLTGLDISDRLNSVPEPVGYVNMKDKILKEALIPYTSGDSFGIVAWFKSAPAGDADARVNLKTTIVKWDNQEQIEEKVKNTTITTDDKLIFTPMLPQPGVGEPPFTAVVVLNNHPDYKIQIDHVENGKPFEVAPPMKDLPPSEISVNIKIYRENQLVHEYQSGEVKAEAFVMINGSGTMVVERTKEELPYNHDFTATASPVGEYKFIWSLGEGAQQTTEGKQSSNVSGTYSAFKTYKPKVTLLDMQGKELSTYEVILELKEKIKPSGSPVVESTKPEVTLSPSNEPEYAWVLVDVKDFEQAEDWSKAKEHEVYDYDYSYGQGSYSATTTYTGRTEDWRTPPKKNGENLGLSASFSSPPQIIYPEEPVSITLSFSVAANGLSYYTFGGSAGANFDEPDLKPSLLTRNAIRFVNKDGQHHFAIDAKNEYASINETLTAQLKSGKEGQRLALRTNFFMGVPMGTNYIYEWKPVN